MRNLCLLLIFLPCAAQIDEPVAPAFAAGEMRAFDFWIGAWDVSLP